MEGAPKYYSVFVKIKGQRAEASSPSTRGLR